MTTTPLLQDAECPHGLEAAWCSICRDRAGYMSGSDRQRNDCSIIALQTLTGCEYGEAEVLLAETGKRGGRGSSVETLVEALSAAGWTATPTTSIGRSGSYLVAAWIGREGHAFAVVDGKLHNAGKYARARKQLAWKLS